jgi:hypothetical protein
VMRVALARHDVLFEHVVRDHGASPPGPVAGGDNRFAAFASAPRGVAAAVAIRRAFVAGWMKAALLRSCRRC